MAKKFLLLVGIIFFASFSVAQASVVINEIMYDLDAADIDYLEVLNQGSADIDLPTLKLLISNSTSNHTINASSGSSILHSGDFGIIVPTSSIANYISKWGSAGNIFTSSFSLPNTTAKVEINDGDKTAPISSVTYDSSQGGAGDGKSLQKISGSWVGAIPTPGVTNETVVSPPPAPDSGGGGSSGGTSSGSSGPSGSAPTASTAKIKIKIIGKTLAFTSIPLELQAQAFGYNGEQLPYGKYFWNFGDGDSKEARDSLSFSHTYFYPGEYPVSLEYYANYYSEIPDAMAKIIIKAVSMNVSISKVGEVNDFFIELSNNTDYEIDISKWILSSLNSLIEKKFTLPKNTVILAKKKVVLAPKITNFTFEDAKNLKLSTDSGQLVFDYGSSPAFLPVVVEKKISTAKVSETTSMPLLEKTEINKQSEQSKVNSELQISGEDLSGAVISSETFPEENNSSRRAYILMLILIIFVGACSSIVYFIRPKKSASFPGGDFKILDE